MSSIKYGIDSKDIVIISDIYDNILEKTKTRIEGKQYEIANLINIKDEAVKGVLASKVLEAQDQSITVHLEVSDVFEVSRMELLDFITVLSIFLDNAIEAAEQCQKENRKIWMSIQNINEMFLMNLKNTCETSPLKKIINLLRIRRMQADMA